MDASVSHGHAMHYDPSERERQMAMGRASVRHTAGGMHHHETMPDIHGSQMRSTFSQP